MTEYVMVLEKKQEAGNHTNLLLTVVFGGKHIYAQL